MKIVDLNIPHLYLVPPLGVTTLEFGLDFYHQKTSSCLCDPIFSHFGTIPACNR